MTQDHFFLLAMALLGAYAVSWTRRLAPAWSELPLKTLLATALAAGVVLADVAGFGRWPLLSAVAMVASVLWLLGPMALPALARSGRWRLAEGLGTALYWTEPGRDAVRRLLAQAALQLGEADAALSLLPRRDGTVMEAQARVLKGEWAAVLALDLPEAGGAAALGTLARVRSLVATGRMEEAQEATRSLHRLAHSAVPDPLAYRAWVLAEARLDAEAGHLRRVQEAFMRPPPGVPADEMLGLLARAAEQAGDQATAMRFHGEAYRLAPPARRAAHAAVLSAAGQELPEPARLSGRSTVTLGLLLVIAAAFAAQTLLDGRLGAMAVGRVLVEPSQVAAAFVLGLPGLPSSEAWWRFLSYAFVHANLVHVGFNLWVLWDLGRLVELRRGPGYLLMAFALGTAMGAYLSSVAQAGSALVLVGASGGVLGVAGALLADLSRRRSRSDRELLGNLLRWMGLIALLSVAIPNVSLWGHLGGAVGGLLWGFARQGLPGDRWIDVLAGAVAALLLAMALGQALRVGVSLL